jgi:hypothetical protein
MLAWLLAFSAVNDAFADDPATEFFVVDSAQLAAHASDDTMLDSISGDQLGKISVLRGLYTGGLSMKSTAARFRIDARFTAAFSDTEAAIGYNISASSNPETWDVCAEQGTARRTGKQFVTENWRTSRLAVVFRRLYLKK